MRLNEFRLETYHERSLLSWALSVFEDARDHTEQDRKTIDDLKVRLSRTQCQPGGCEICRD